MVIRTKEREGKDFAVCPNCSRMYAMRDEKGNQEETPSKCKRCGCPMDDEAAKEFQAKRSKKEHNPMLAGVGARMRGFAQPPADTAQRPVVTKG